MGIFSYISVAKEDQFLERYRLLKKLGRRFRDAVIPHMPEYIYGVVKDMGVLGYEITGCWLCIPPPGDGCMLEERKLDRAVSRCIKFGSNVLTVSQEVQSAIKKDYSEIRMSNGMYYAPFTFIDAVKQVSALMGIDFRRCNICILDASTPMGMVITELLLDEVLYLTLCSSNKDVLLPKVHNYILKSGLSPAVVSDYRKAVSTCDILIYTGKADIVPLTGCISKKVLIVNITQEEIRPEKDLLQIDDVILKGQNEPVIDRCRIMDSDIFLTSRMWEAALLSLSSINTNIYRIEDAYELYRLSKAMDIRIKTIISGGRTIDRYEIYKYR